MSRRGLAPAEELADRLGIGGPGVGVADIDGEEFEEAAGGVVADVGDDGRDAQPVGPRCEGDRSTCYRIHAVIVLVGVIIGHNALYDLQGEDCQIECNVVRAKSDLAAAYCSCVTYK